MSGSHGGEYEDESLLGYSTDEVVMFRVMMEAVYTSETSEAVCTSETSIYSKESTRRYVAEGSHLQF
jgi:hypothetical protein